MRKLNSNNLLFQTKQQQQQKLNIDSLTEY